MKYADALRAHMDAYPGTGGRSTIPGGMYCSIIELTGADAARLVARLPDELRPTIVVIHSWNTPGAERMASILRDAGLHVIIQVFKAGSLG